MPSSTGPYIFAPARADFAYLIQNGFLIISILLIRNSTTLSPADIHLYFKAACLNFLGAVCFFLVLLLPTYCILYEHYFTIRIAISRSHFTQFILNHAGSLQILLTFLSYFHKLVSYLVYFDVFFNVIG